MQKTTDYLDRWLTEGRMSSAQHDAIGAIVSRRRVSLFVELNVMLYLGVLAFVGGLAWTARTYSDRWGDLAILLPMTALVVGSFAYVIGRTPAYSNEHVASSHLLFDYVLYLACLVLGVEIGYVEQRYAILQSRWDYYLLASALVYFASAYRFDNRFVLSLAIATLGGWFGVRLSRLEWIDDRTMRLAAVSYGMLLVAIGSGLHRAGIKRHFLDAYLHVAANVVLAALASGVVASDHFSPWLIPALAAAAVVVAGGIRFRRFAFIVYGTFFGYVALSRELLRHIDGIELSLAFIVVTASLAAVWLVSVSRKMGRDA